MDSFPSSSSSFGDELIHEDMLLWPEFSLEPFDIAAAVAPPSLLSPPAPDELPRSAFVGYVEPEARMPVNEKVNIHRRVIELLRRMPRPESSVGGESSRGFRHMMRERQRRERLSQSYADLHTMLPYGSKADKNSIVQSAAAYVKELKGAKEELQRRNEEMELMMRRARRSNSSAEGPKVRIPLGSPTSTLDSMISALQCFRAMNVRATAIQTEFSGHEMTAIVTIESNKSAD